MYHQVLYQIGNKLNNTLQNSDMDPVQRLVFSFIMAGVIATAVYIGYQTFKDAEMIKDGMKKYKKI